MFYTINNDLVFYQVISYIKKYTNLQIMLYNYFIKKTYGISPELIIILNNYIFFFVKNENYFSSRTYLPLIRREIKNKSVLIIRTENILINLIFSLFPDLYIHDIKIEMNNKSGKREISIYFLFFKERGLAVGVKGSYVKTINELFKNYIIFENRNKPLEVRCKVII